MKTTITTIQRNTKQVQPGYWTTTLPNSQKVISNIVKIAAGEYGCTHDLSRHNSFMACLAHIMPLFKEALSVARKAFVKRIALGSLLVAAGVITGAAHASEGGLAAANGFPAAYEEINTALHDPNGRDFNRAMQVAQNRLGLSAADAEMFVSKIETGKIQPMTTLTPATQQQVTPEHVSHSVESSKADKKAERNTVDHTPPTETVKGRYTVKNYLKANTPRNGLDGKDGKTGNDGAAGNDGVTTVITRSEVDTATQQQVSHNTASIAGNRADIRNNSQRIDENSKRIDETRKEVKRVGAMSQAIAGLHYNRSESGAAVAVGEYSGNTAIAGGAQFNTSDNSAATVGVSWDGESVGANVGWHTSF